VCYWRVWRESDGDHTAVSKSQQLYQPVDLYGVQRPPTASSGALLSHHAAEAIAGGRNTFVVCDVIYGHRTSAAVGIAIETIGVVTVPFVQRVQKQNEASK